MLQNPIHLRLERLESWQHVTFMACLCERMYPNYAMFCKQTEFGDGQIYRRILDLIWETLTVKDAKVNFDSQLEKFEEAIPAADDYDLYGVYPAIDACVALSELMHSRLSGETLEHAIEVSKTSITTVAMLEMTQAGREMTDEELKTNPAVEQEWDIQWEIFRIRVAVQYIEAWISGNGCVPIYGLMEDAATAEISRTSIWQWIHHEKTLSNGKPVTKALFREMLAEEMRVIQDELGEHRYSSGRFDDAARLMEQITTSDDLIDFLTLPGYRLLA
ncbi:DUF416 family protein [Salmonella enterica subsp. enterica serovar Heidelberg]|nr:DUF416 family protein [Salmonella enterica subsp. enterica serovar Heidelberg]